MPEEPPPRPPIARVLSGVAFLALVLAGCALGLALLGLPAMNGLAALLTRAGQPTLGPAAYGRHGWEAATRSYPPAFFVEVAVGESLFLVFAIAGALILRGGLMRRLGLGWPRGGWRVLALAIALEVLTLFFGASAVGAFLPAGWRPPAGYLELAGMLSLASTGWWVAIVIAVSAIAGVGEEALFRGLIQRRLLEGWRPSAAILATGLVFTFLHPPLARSLALLPGCLWLGYLAWRCDSILPGIVLHAGTNAGLQVLIRHGPSAGPPSFEPSSWMIVAALASGALCIGLLALLHRWTRPAAAA